MSQLNLKNYNITNSVTFYEKYVNTMKLAYNNNTNSKIEDPFVPSIEKILLGLKQAAEELKKKNNFVKGKDGTKKIFDELIQKFVYKKDDEKMQNSDKLLIDQNDILLYDFMMKNGLVKMPTGKEELDKITDPVALKNHILSTLAGGAEKIEKFEKIEKEKAESLKDEENVSNKKNKKKK
jgi:hypothetical protein